MNILIDMNLSPQGPDALTILDLGALLSLNRAAGPCIALVRTGMLPDLMGPPSSRLASSRSTTSQVERSSSFRGRDTGFRPECVYKAARDHVYRRTAADRYPRRSGGMQRVASFNRNTTDQYPVINCRIASMTIPSSLCSYPAVPDCSQSALVRITHDLRSSSVAG